MIQKQKHTFEILDYVKIGWEIPQVFYSCYFWHLASLPVPPRLEHCLVMRKSGEKSRKSVSILKALPDAPPDSLSIWKEGKISPLHYHILAAGFEESLCSEQVLSCSGIFLHLHGPKPLLANPWVPQALPFLWVKLTLWWWGAREPLQNELWLRDEHPHAVGSDSSRGSLASGPLQVPQTGPPKSSQKLKSPLQDLTWVSKTIPFPSQNP